MTSLEKTFLKLENILRKDGQSEIAALLKNSVEESKHIDMLKKLFGTIFKEIDDIVCMLRQNENILISVKQQKQLRASFQLITSLGIAPCLLPGVGVPLSKRCSTAVVLPCITLNDEEKYELLVLCTDFFTRHYPVPVLRSIILTFHLCDYLAALIQLSFAPLKKPGVYENFTMTPERHQQLMSDRQKFVSIYNHLVSNCFQPTLMKELLVLTGADTSPPNFVKKVVAQEMSRRLLAPGGLLSLIRCFIECYKLDTGHDWSKINMICKIVVFKHGTISEDEYLSNICSQLTQILTTNNTHYLTFAVACAISLNQKYPQHKPVQNMSKEMLQSFDYASLASKATLPGTFILSPQEVENRMNILEACVNTKIDYPLEILSNNIPVLFHLGILLESEGNKEMLKKVSEIILRCLEKCEKPNTKELIKHFIFGETTSLTNISIAFYEAGIGIKNQECCEEHSLEAAEQYFLQIFRTSQDIEFAHTVLDTFLQLFVELTEKRSTRTNKDLLELEDDIRDLDKQYAAVLHTLMEIAAEAIVVTSLKKNSSSVLRFVEYFLVKNAVTAGDDCTAICLYLLVTLLPDAPTDVRERCGALIPVLEKLSKDDSNLNTLLCREAINMIKFDRKTSTDSACERSITDVLDSCLPVRAHGVIELTKLLNAKDPETLSKKHFLLCLFQENLKDSDSYVYLAAVNGLAALGMHCTEDVLSTLCKEYLNLPLKTDLASTAEQNVEMRMKIGDVIVKVTKGLGEMAVQHKTILLNTVLCACREPEPMLRASALSALAELARALRYNMGTILYEVLLCIWNTIETDPAIECRRAAVMVISSLLKGLGNETLIELKENLLPIYRTLKRLYGDDKEDDVVRLHAQIALEELNDIVNQFMFPEVKMARAFTLDK